MLDSRSRAVHIYSPSHVTISKIRCSGYTCSIFQQNIWLESALNAENVAVSIPRISFITTTQAAFVVATCLAVHCRRSVIWQSTGLAGNPEPSGLTFRVPSLAKHASTSCSAPQRAHLFYVKFRSVWWEYGNKTFLNYYGTLPVSFVYSLLSAPSGTWSEIWFFWSTCISYVGRGERPTVYCTLGWSRSQWGRKQWHWWEWKILVSLKNKKISSRGPLSWRNSMFVSCVFKRRWRLGGRKCRQMPESDICVCRKAKVVELHIVCMLKQS